MKNITFGNILEKLLYISQQKKASLAKAIGYDVSYVNKWILSKYLPSAKRINEICENISEFITDSLDDSTKESLIEYFEIPADSDIEYIKNYLENRLKHAYMSTADISNKAVQNIPKNTHSEEYYNSRSHVKPTIIYKTFFNELTNQSDKEEKLEILLSLNLFYLNHKDKLALSDMKSFFHELSHHTNIKANFLIGLDADNKEDEAMNTLLAINLISSYPSVNFKIYNCNINSNTVIFAIKDKYISTSIFFDEGECLFTTNSKDTVLVDEYYSNIKYTLKNKGKLLCYKESPISMIEDQNYIQYIMNNDLRCLLGTINEFFMPPELFMDIAYRVFGNDRVMINELKKINVFLQNITYKSNLKVLIYESEIRKYLSTGCLHFFNQPVTLTFKEREQHIEYLEKLLSEDNGIDIKLVDGNFVEDFKNKENPSLYLSKNLKFTKVHPESGRDDYFIVTDVDFKNMCDNLFDTLWNERQDIVLDDKQDILDRIRRSISYTKIINETLGETIE